MSSVREFQGKIIPTLTVSSYKALASQEYFRLCSSTCCAQEYVRCDVCIFCCLRPSYIGSDPKSHKILENFLMTDKEVLANLL